MITAHPPISNSSNPLIKYLGIITGTPVINGVTVSFMLHSFFSSFSIIIIIITIIVVIIQFLALFLVSYNPSLNHSLPKTEGGRR